MKKKIIILLFLLFIHLLFGHSKIDPDLEILYSQLFNQNEISFSNSFLEYLCNGIDLNDPTPYISVNIKYNNLYESQMLLDEQQDLIEIKLKYESVATIAFYLSDLYTIANKDYIEYIRSPKAPESYLYKSANIDSPGSCKAKKAREENFLDGSDVLVCIVDFGFNCDNKDLWKDSYETKIYKARAYSSGGTFVNYSQSEIESGSITAIGNPLLREHGTRVAGIACSHNNWGTTVGKDLTGIAPNSKICLCSVTNDSDISGCYEFFAQTAANYRDEFSDEITSIYSDTGRDGIPYVIIQAIGPYIGARSPSCDLFAQQIDEFLDLRNDGNFRGSLTCASGNQQELDICVTNTSSSDDRINLNIKANDGDFNDYDEINIYYPASECYDLRIKTPNNTNTRYVDRTFPYNTGTTTSTGDLGGLFLFNSSYPFITDWDLCDMDFEKLWGVIVVDNSMTDICDGYKRINIKFVEIANHTFTVTMSDGTTRSCGPYDIPIYPGDWTIELIDHYGGSVGDWYCYINPFTVDAEPSLTPLDFFDHFEADFDHLMTPFSTSEKGISVGSYSPRERIAHSFCRGTRTPEVPQGQESLFSSRGHDFDGYYIPNILAPGELISAPYHFTGCSGPEEIIISGTQYRYCNGDGTSYATPHMGGALALLYQQRDMMRLAGWHDDEVDNIDISVIVDDELGHCSSSSNAKLNVEELVENFDAVEPITFNLELNAGWNLISVPVVNLSQTVYELFGVEYPDEDENSDLFHWGHHWNPTDLRYEGSYCIPDESNRAIPGYAYFLFSDINRTVPIKGIPIKKFKQRIYPYWNTMGTAYQDGPYPSFNCTDFSTTSRIVDAGIFVYNTTTRLYDVIEFDEPIYPGEAYWFLNQTLSDEQYFTHPTAFYSITGSSRFAQALNSLPNFPIVNDGQIDEAPDVNHYELEVLGNTVTVKDAATDLPAENVLVVIEKADTFVTGETDSLGNFEDSLVVLDDSTTILCHKPEGHVGHLYPPGEIHNQDEIIWGGDVYIRADIVVPNGKKLTIKEGTTLHFAPNSDSKASGNSITQCELIVEGELVIEGTQENPVVLKPKSGGTGDNQWYGIVVQNGGEIHVDHAEIENANYSVLAVTDPSEVELTNVTLSDPIKVNYSQSTHTREFKGDGITTTSTITLLELGLNCYLRNSLLDGNDVVQTPLVFNNKSAAGEFELTNTEIREFTDKAIDASNTEMVMSDCHIHDSYGNGSYGIYADNASDITMTGSTVEECNVNVYVANGSNFWAGDTDPDGEAGNTIQNASSYLVRNANKSPEIYCQNVYWGSDYGPDAQQIDHGGSKVYYFPWTGDSRYDCSLPNVHCVPCEYNSISSAIAAVTSASDIVYIQSGTYTPNGSIAVNNPMYITGESPTETIIDGQGVQSVFTTTSLASGNDIHVSDLKIYDGYDNGTGLTTSGGGAWRVINSDGTVYFDNVIFEDCATYSQGGAIWTYYSPIDVNNCVFTGNTCTNGGGSIEGREGESCYITNSTFYNNSGNYGGAIRLLFKTNNLIENNVIYNNSSARTGNVTLQFTTNKIYHNTLYDNDATLYDGALTLTGGYCDSKILGNLFYGNTGATANDIGMHVNSTYDYLYNLLDITGVYNWSYADANIGNFTSAPGFVDAATYDLRLDALSACIDVSPDTLDADSTDHDGTPRDTLPDVGAFEYPDGGYGRAATEWNDPTPDNVPTIVELGNPVPNPFNSTVSIDFLVREESDLEITIHDINGKLIRTIIDENVQTGHWATTWDGRDNAMNLMTSGVYFIKLNVNGRTVESKSVTLIK